MDEKKSKLRKLIPLYLLILILTILFVSSTHLFPQPSFMPLRFPHYLEMMKPLLGISWPLTFEIYHWTLVVLVTILLTNMLGILFKPWRSIAKISSFIGLAITSLMVSFFFFVFVNVNLPNAIIYGLYSGVLLIVDFLTFKTLVRN